MRAAGAVAQEIRGSYRSSRFPFARMPRRRVCFIATQTGEYYQVRAVVTNGVDIPMAG